MAPAKTDGLKKILIDAGFEIYRADDGEIQLAERVRLHIMDSGIRVRLEDRPVVSFAVRAQRSDFPRVSDEELFAKIREAVSELARERGFKESEAETRKVTDPMDEEKVLDVWAEVTFSKSEAEVEAMIDDLRWAFDLEKCLTG